MVAADKMTEKEAVQLQILFLDIYLDAGSLLALPVSKTFLSSKISRFPPPTSKLYSATKKIRAFLDYVGELGDMSLLSFTANDWTRLIMILTLSFRLSFPLAQCPDFEWAWASSEIQLDRFLSKLSRDENPAVASNGMLSANHAVLGVLKSKYSRRLSMLGESPTAPRRTFGCPMMGKDRGLNLAGPQWDSSLTHVSEPSTDSDMPEMLPMFHDMWTTAAGGWQGMDDIPWDSFDAQLNSMGTTEGEWSV